jgi:hypothetical protein
MPVIDFFKWLNYFITRNAYASNIMGNIEQKMGESKRYQELKRTLKHV